MIEINEKLPVSWPINGGPKKTNNSLISVGIATPVILDPVVVQIIDQPDSTNVERSNRLTVKSMRFCLFGNEPNKKRTTLAFFVLAICIILIIDLNKIKVNGKQLAFENMILPLVGIFLGINVVRNLYEQNRFDCRENDY